MLIILIIVGLVTMHPRGHFIIGGHPRVFIILISFLILLQGRECAIVVGVSGIVLITEGQETLFAFTSFYGLNTVVVVVVG